MERRKRPGRAGPAETDEQWRLEPSEVDFHRRRMRRADDEPPSRGFGRYVVVLAMLAATAAIYWNVAGVRDFGADWVATLGLGSTDPTGPSTRAGNGELSTEVVEGAGVAGVPMATSADGDAPPAAEGAEAAAATEDATADAAAPTPPTPTPAERALDPEPTQSAGAGADAADPQLAREAAPVEPPAAPAPPPELPNTPESFGFGLNVMQVSESDASAAVLVLRDGGRRGISYFTWWTTDGTANAGSDFARLEPRTERFGNGEQNRTIYVPIIGDRNVEGPESFFVHVVAGQSRDAPGERVAEIEVIINDDD